ncbi:MAG TPA: biosynthetic peptidoglycan transglycosylase [Actinomycetota bacterium]|nr:biosynthetic peptidoglycan transglycosylase [Actinomycetota bacterium]
MVTHDAVAVPLETVSPFARQAVVAAEDERFYRHHGVDVIGILRALAYDASHLSLRQGASTITEQLAKELYLGGNDHSAWLKLEDAVLAVRIESHMSKEQIRDEYLNTVYFGHGAFRIKQAAERYFHASPARLTLAQSSLVAGLIHAPSADDPFSSPRAARLRQADVLTSMIHNHDVTLVEADRVLATPLSLAGA